MTLRLPLSLCSTLRFPIVAALTLFAPLLFALKVPIDDGIHRAIHPALGISDDFGRWNSTIRMVYDPDGAPAGYSQNKVLALVREAYGYWTLVSGVRFELVGVDAGAPDDFNANPAQRDGLVRIAWGPLGGNAGLAGPAGSFFDSSLGYFPYEDGSVELNNQAGVIESDVELVGVLVHELGHLLGLGHSDNPDSVMFANPYTNLLYPRPDDIRAMQVMYGPPATALDIERPVTAWLYTPPPQASAATTQFLFKPNFHSASGSGAYFTVDDTTVTSVTNSTPGDEFVVFWGALGGSGSASINIGATFVVIDPNGYLYRKKAWTLTCPANTACVPGNSVAATDVMKKIPGTWKIYVINEAGNQTLVSASIPVTATPTYNKGPIATVTATPGSSPAQARFTVTATDPEGDAIEVVWHPPGLSGFNTDVRNSFASGGSASLNVNFSQTGTHTFFIEVRDNRPRYGDGPQSSPAGEGFQTLLRVTATLPAATVEVVSTQDVSTTSPASQQVLSAIAKNTAAQVVSNTGGFTTVLGSGASFTYGASSDQGVTTKTSFTAGDKVIIAGGVKPQTADVGKAADVFIVVRTTVGSVDTWTYRNSTGQFVPWSVTIPTLQPAYSVSSLQTSQAFEVHNGSLVPAQHRIYIGYRLSGGATLYYTGQAHTLSVGN